MPPSGYQMGLPVLRGLAEETEGLNQLGMSLANIINPNWQNQLEMQRRIMMQPEMLQELAEVERNAPGTIEKLGFGKRLTGIIQSTPESLARKESREIRGLQLEGARQDIEIGRNRLKEFEQKQAEYIKTLQGAENFKKYDLNAMVNNLAEGKPVPPDFLTALAEAGDENQQVFGYLFQNASQMRQIQAQHERAIMQINRQDRLASAREDKQFQQHVQVQARQSFQEYRVGTPKAWEQFYTDPTLQERAMLLAQDPTQVGKDRTIPRELDAQLQQMGQAMARDVSIGKETRTRAHLTQARIDLNAARNAKKPEEKIGHLQAVNQRYAAVRADDPTFNVSARLDGKTVALVDENTGLLLKDEDARIPAASITRIFNAVQESNPNRYPSFRSYIDDLVREANSKRQGAGIKINLRKYLDTVKKNHGPEVYEIVKRRVTQ